VAEYAPLARYGVIGDLHTAALVSAFGSLDWLCAPRFDSPSVFAALLDDAKGGRWRICLVGATDHSQRYIEGTNVLQTIHHARNTELIITDFMPVARARGAHVEVHRVVQCIGGGAEIDIEFTPRFGYATERTTIRQRAYGWIATDAQRDVATLSATPGIAWSLDSTTLRGRASLRDGDRVAFVLRCDDDEVHAVSSFETQGKLNETIAWWREWAGRLRYNGPYRDMVERSALTLKLCCYAPSGAIVAAPTTSLPEAPGAARNWDYRYTWLRDSAFVSYALERLGYVDEVDAFTNFIKRIARRADGGPIQIMYDLDGGRHLPERVLEHLEGYGGAKPVRIGNAAASQFQLDVYGELLEMLRIRYWRTLPSEGLWEAMHSLVAWAADHWREPDWSIWEARMDARHYVFSKVMAWVALDRGASLAQQGGFPGDVARWRREAALIQQDVLANGWDPVRLTFRQAYDGDDLDAAVLVIPTMRFLPRLDPRIRQTIDAVHRELNAGSDDLIFRYRGPDGLLGAEGAFVICSFWLAQAHALAGDFATGEALFQKLLARATPLGLYGEQIDPATGAHLGNFPQAFSHAAVMTTALVLERLRPRRVAAASESFAAGTGS
jgi:GH15 family glucan-1,4-alpha-glucosidase